MITDLVAAHAATSPDKPALRLVLKSGETSESIGYRALWRSARRLSSHLLSFGVYGTIGIACRSPISTAVAILACFDAGATCTVVEPSEVDGIGFHLDSASPSMAGGLVLTDTGVEVEGWAAAMIGGGFQLLSSCERAAPSKTPRSDAALRQFTSGTTGNPRTVLVSHGNIEAGCTQAAASYRLTRSDEFISWTPLHYSMGTMNAVLLPLYLGATSTVIEPRVFIADPASWLRAIDRYGGTYSSAPTFGYERCADRISPAEAEALDLRSWRVARAAAGPLWADAFRRFNERFHPSGFRPESFCPSYGLTEATLFVTATSPGEPYSERVTESTWSGSAVVSAGRPVPDTVISIVDPESGEELESGRVGEIVVSGPQVATVLGEADRCARALPTGDRSRVLATGDLGTIVDGRLWVVGRRREMVKIRGTAHSLAAIEHAIGEAANDLAVTKLTALAASGPMREALWIIAELHAEELADAAILQIARTVPKATGIRADRITLVRSEEIPMTSSGKARRFECLQRLVDGKLATVAEWASNDS